LRIAARSRHRKFNDPLCISLPALDPTNESRFVSTLIDDPLWEVVLRIVEHDLGSTKANQKKDRVLLPRWHGDEASFPFSIARICMSSNATVLPCFTVRLTPSKVSPAKGSHCSPEPRSEASLFQQPLSHANCEMSEALASVPMQATSARVTARRH